MNVPYGPPYSLSFDPPKKSTFWKLQLGTDYLPVFTCWNWEIFCRNILLERAPTGGNYHVVMSKQGQNCPFSSEGFLGGFMYLRPHYLKNAPEPSARPWQNALMPVTPGVCGKFYGFRTPGTLQMTQSGASRAACQSLKRSSRSDCAFRGPGLISSREEDHHRV